jgi:predicted nuclease of predicted toxin-antitoxin system
MNVLDSSCWLAYINDEPLADSIIYAAAQKSEAILWTTDAHFENLPDVRYFPKA